MSEEHVNTVAVGTNHVAISPRVTIRATTKKELRSKVEAYLQILIKQEETMRSIQEAMALTTGEVHA